MIESPTSIISCCETDQFCEIWSIKEDVLHVTRIGDFISLSFVLIFEKCSVIASVKLP